MQEIYFDNSATTRVSAVAAQAAQAAMREHYGNPSSAHRLGVAAARLLEASRQSLADCLSVATDELYFCSCGSEANNLAIVGAAESYARQGKRVLVSAIEHPSLLVPAKYLAERGYDVQYIPVDGAGYVNLQALAALLTPETVFVGLHQVNNEIGVVQPLAEIGRLVRTHAPQAFYHIDAVQALGKLPLEPGNWQADSLALSGHKIHAPKGVGLLWLKKGRRLNPLIRGGGQERGLRAGTENLPGIAAFAAAAQQACAKREQNARQMREVKQALLQGLLSIEGAALNGPPPQEAAPHICNISFCGTKSEVLLHYLEERGLYVSEGSACSAHQTAASHVLAALALPPERSKSALRFSLSAESGLAEAEAAVAVVKAAVAELRDFMQAVKNRGGRK